MTVVVVMMHHRIGQEDPSDCVVSKLFPDDRTSVATGSRLTLVDVIAHDRDGVVNLGVDTSGFRVGKVGTAARRIGASVPRRDVGVVTAVVLCGHVE